MRVRFLRDSLSAAVPASAPIPSGAVLPGAAATYRPDAAFAITEVRGISAILKHQSSLLELGSRCHQPAAASYLEYFLRQPYTGGKLPVLLLFHRLATAQIDQDELVGAVLVYQYRRFGLPLGLFVTEDTDGLRNVIAPADQRDAFTSLAAQYLLGHAAHIVLIALQSATIVPAGFTPLPEAPKVQHASLERTVARRLPLATTYEATLATLGAHTRRNLRAYRRRAVDQLGCTFDPVASISESEFIALNHLCTYPTPDAVTAWRYRSIHSVPGGFLCGLRRSTGEWLSLLGGRRCAGTTYIDWQLNRRDLASFSLSTVLRSFVIDHESKNGIDTLLFEGGTPHSIRLAFRADPVVDRLFLRRTLFGRLLRRFLPVFLPSAHPLSQALRHPRLRPDPSLH